MFDSDVLIWSTLRVTISLVDLFEDLKPLSYLPDDRVPLVHLMCEAFTRKSDEERGGIHVGTPIRHGHEAPPVEDTFGRELIIKVPFLRSSTCQAPDGAAPAPCVSGVTTLGDVVLLDIIHECVVIVLDLAKLQEVLRGPRALLGVQVHHQIPQRGLQQH